MKRMLVLGILVLVLFAPLMTITMQRALAEPDPTVGLGYIFDFDPSPYSYDIATVDGIKDPQGSFKVNQGVSYLVTLREVEFNHADISVHGSYMDGTKWEIVIGTDIPADGTDPSNGWYYWFTVTIPDTPGAGCTGTVHYRKGASDTSGNPNDETHVAAEEPAAVWDPMVNDHHQKAGHFKVYYPGGDAVPCVEVGVPEFPFASAVAISLGLIGALLIRRRQKKLK